MSLDRRPVYGLNFTVQDRDKNNSTVGFFVDTVNTIAEIELAATTYYIPDLQALTDGVVKSWSVTSIWEESALALAPETSDVERKGVFSFRASNGAAFTMSIPSIKNTKVIDRSNIVNAADTDVAKFISDMLSSGLLALVRPRTYLGADLASFDKAEKHHRGSTRG